MSSTLESVLDAIDAEAAILKRNGAAFAVQRIERFVSDVRAAAAKGSIAPW